MRTRFLNTLGSPLRAASHMFKRFVAIVAHAGTARWCPVCEKSSRRFKPYGVTPRQDAMCPHCSALERHRFVWLYFKSRTDLLSAPGKNVLHIAPESCFEPRLRRILGESYLTADISNPNAMVKMDIMDIRFPDRSFDVIYCSHVLEHVEDDKRALREFFRILRDNGWAIILVPIYSDETFEDPSITDPEERRKLFGQDDHVRRYGPDFIDRLRDARFHVVKHLVPDLFDAATCQRMGLTSASGEIFFCTKLPAKHDAALI